VDFASGKKAWSVNAKAEFRAPKGFFGIACSPLVQGNSVLLIVGGRGGIVAFDKSNGKVRWKTGADEPSYSSPTISCIKGKAYAFFLTREALVAAEPDSGKVYFRFPFRPAISSSVTAATPVIHEDGVFLSASYGAGAALLKITGETYQKVWESDDALSAHYATPVYYAGHLYGIHGRTDPGFEPPVSLRCVDWNSGKVVWEQSPFGAATLILAGDELLILTERGELIRSPASPSGFKPSARSQILPNQVRAHFALSDGLLFARSKDTFACVDLK
jgi:outer membrane protein assembly factor BamB